MSTFMLKDSIWGQVGSQKIIMSTQLLNEPCVCAHMNLHTTYTTYVLNNMYYVVTHQLKVIPPITHRNRMYMHVHVNVHMLTIAEYTKNPFLPIFFTICCILQLFSMQPHCFSQVLDNKKVGVDKLQSCTTEYSFQISA